MKESLAEVIQSLIETFQAPYLVPALTFTGGILGIWEPGFLLNLSDPETLWLVFTGSVFISYLLYAMNAPLIRLVEGYPFREELVGYLLKRRHMLHRETLYKQKEGALAEMASLDAKIREEIALQERGLKGRRDLNKLRKCYHMAHLKYTEAAQDLFYFYSPFEGKVLPTLVGNIIAAFESYSAHRYGMDSVILWPRFVPCLYRRGYAKIISMEKSVFDFLLNSWILSIVFGILSGIIIVLRRSFTSLWITVGSWVGAWLIYKGIVYGALNWGATVTAAFDLYRKDLLVSLGLPPQTSLREEKEVWGRFSEFVRRGGDLHFDDIKEVENGN